MILNHLNQSEKEEDPVIKMKIAAVLAMAFVLGEYADVRRPLLDPIVCLLLPSTKIHIIKISLIFLSQE